MNPAKVKLFQVREVSDDDDEAKGKVKVKEVKESPGTSDVDMEKDRELEKSGGKEIEESKQVDKNNNGKPFLEFYLSSVKPHAVSMHAILYMQVCNLFKLFQFYTSKETLGRFSSHYLYL